MRDCARALGVAALLVAGAGAAPVPAAAQDDIDEMISECAGPLAPSLMSGPCTDAALALGAARAGVGLAAAQGAPVPGSSSTLGRRMASSPRLAFSLRAGLVHAPLADPGTGGGAPDEGAFSTGALEGGVTVGVLEGWSLAPTVGGFLSLDLLATAGLAGLPGGSGFDDSVEAIGYGARLGIFRESFTLPGVSASIARRHVSEVQWGRETGEGAGATFRPVVTSLRLTAAKDLLALGVLAGWGWDRNGGRSAIRVQRTVAGIADVRQASSDDFATDRQLVFGGLSYTLLVLQLSGELGWAKGWSGPSGTGGWEGDASSFFGSVAARLTY
jgi:hypothetical protein